MEDCKDRMLYRLGGADMLYVGMECYGTRLPWFHGTDLTTPIDRKEDDSRRLSGSEAMPVFAPSG